MAKNSISDYDTTAANNTDIQSTDISEGCPASGINNAIREMMADTADAFTQGTPIALDQTNNRVGVGTTSPSTKIHLNESGSANAVQRIQAGVNGYAAQLHLIGNNVGGSAYNAIQSFVNADSTPQWEITGPEASAEDQMLLHTGGSERMRIDSSGNVGIGTSSPAVEAHIQTSSGNPELRIQSTGANYVSMSLENSSRRYSTQIRTDQSNAYTVRDETGGANRLRIFTNGNSNFSAEHAGTISTFENAHGSSPHGIDVAFTATAPDNNSRYFYRGRDNAINRYYVYSDGDVQNHDNSYSGISDLKLKQQVADAASQWDDIKALQVRKFKFNSDVEAHGDSDALWRLGVVAQEVEAAGMNGLVTSSPDYDEDDNELDTVTKAVKYSILYMKAVKALQEAMDRIETLETEMTALKARVTALEA